jgi:hypothetical protein
MYYVVGLYILYIISNYAAVDVAADISIENSSNGGNKPSANNRVWIEIEIIQLFRDEIS